MLDAINNANTNTVSENIDLLSDSYTVNDSSLREISNIEPVHFKELLGRALDSAMFELEVDERRVLVNVKDKETGELIRTIPPEEFVEMSKNIEKYFDTILVDEYA